MKHLPRKKLALRHETVRQLDGDQLVKVNGGTASTLTLYCPPTQPDTQCLKHSLACEY